MRIKPINPVAKAIAQNRRRTATQVPQPKKGKGSYNRKQQRNQMRKTSDFDHDWNDVTIFEKLPVRKVAKKAKKA